MTCLGTVPQGSAIRDAVTEKTFGLSPGNHEECLLALVTLLPTSQSPGNLQETSRRIHTGARRTIYIIIQVSQSKWIGDTPLISLLGRMTSSVNFYRAYPLPLSPARAAVILSLILLS